MSAPVTEELELSDAWRHWRATRASFPHAWRLGLEPLRAYGRDLLELGAWATARGAGPGKLAYRDLRSYAAVLSQRGLEKASVGRKLAATRGLHEHLVVTGAAAANPADLLPTPKRESKLPRSWPRRDRDPADRIPARTPLEVRDRALFELTYSCGLRAEEIVSLGLADVDFDSETVRVTGKGAKTRVLPLAERPSGHCAATWKALAMHSKDRHAKTPALFRVAPRARSRRPTCAAAWRSGFEKRR